MDAHARCNGVTWMEPLPPRMLFSITALGSETLVNPITAQSQINADIAVMDDGSSVAVWQSNLEDGSGWGIYGQRLDAAGNRIGSKFLVNQVTVGDQVQPSVAIDGSGKIVIAWTSIGDIYARIFDPSGSPLSDEILIENAAGTQANPVIAKDTLGNFIVAWNGQGPGDFDGVFGRMFTSDGVAADNSFRVNSTNAGVQDTPSLAVNASGQFVIGWRGASGGTTKIYAQQYSSSGAAMGSQITVGAGSSPQSEPAVGITSTGNFIVAYSQDNGDGNRTEVYARRFSAGGAAIDASSWIVNTFVDKAQQDPSLAMLAGGAFAVTWADERQDSSDTWGVYGQVFNADGSRDGGEFLVNTTIADNQQRPSVSWRGNRLAIAWDGSGPGDSSGIFASTYATPVAKPASVWLADSDALDSVGTNNGTLTNGTAFAGGRIGDAFNFDGIDDFVQIGVPPSLTMTSAVTLDAWIYPTTQPSSVGAQQAILNKEGEYQIARYGDGSVRAAFARPNGTWNWTDSGYIAPANTWTHVTATFDGGIVRMYINGSKRAEIYNGAMTIGDAAPASNDFRIGGRQSASTYFAGRIDQVSVYAAALTASEISEIHATDTSTGNSAPSISGTANLTAIVEDGGANAGTLVSDLIAGRTDDADPGALRGVAITAADTTNGTWEYTVDGGWLWVGFASPTTATALLLGADPGTRVRFVPNANFSGTVNGALQLRAWDQSSGIAGSTADTTLSGDQTPFSDAIASAGVSVSPVNDAPQNIVPASDTTPEDTGVIFSAANGNAISVTDIDGVAGSLSIALSVTSGRLTLASTSGLVFTTGDGIADATMTFTGSFASVNSALAGLNYTPAANTSGTATLTITSNDLGNSGAGGPLSDTDTVDLTITPVNDAPVNRLPPSQTVTGGSVLNLGSGVGAAISVADVDAGSAALEVSLNASVGRLTLASTTGLTFSVGNGINDVAMKFQGTIVDINAALDGMTYNPPALLLGNAEIDITTDDLGSSGAGGAKSDSDTLIVGVSPPNQPPVNTVPGLQTMDEDGNLVFSSTSGNGIMIDDPDAGSGVIQVTLTASQGLLSLSNSAGLTFITGDGTAEQQISMLGTLADIDNALEGLVFSPSANYNGAASIQISTNDQGNSGAGGARVDVDSISISVTSLNDAPIVNTPVTQTMNEDGTLEFRNANGSLLSLTDVDAGSGAMKVSLTGVNGTITLSGIAGLTFSAGDGTADSVVSFTGTLAAINAALDGLIFASAANFSGAAAIDVTVNDQGYTGIGGGVDHIGIVGITVAPVNDAPAVTAPTAGTTPEDTSFFFSSGNGNTISVSDLDVGTGALKVTITASNGRVSLASLAGVTLISGDGTLDSTIVFSGTVASINNALDGLTFEPAADFNGTASLTILASDQGNTGTGGDKTDSKIISLNVTAVNDAPEITGSSSIFTYVEDAAATSIDPTLDIVDVDNVFLTGASVQLIGFIATEDQLSFTSGGGITGVFDANTGTLTLSGSANRSVYRNALRSVAYRNSSNDPNTASRTIRFTVSDGTATSTPFERVVVVQPVNDAPINAIPGAQVVNEDSDLIFLAAGGNGFAVSDADAGSDVLRVTLSAQNGQLTLASLVGLTFIAGDGSGEALMTFEGSAASVNAALDGLAFAPTANFNGPAQVSITTSDGSAADTDVVSITVAPVNDAPTATASVLTVLEDAASSQINLSEKFADLDGDSLTFALSGNSNAALFESVSLDEQTGALVLKYAANANGSADLVIRAVDGGGLAVEMTYRVNVTAVNDAPRLAANSVLQAANGASAKITRELLRAEDVDNAAAQIRFTVSALPQAGELKLGDAKLAVGGTFTQEDINAGRVSYAFGGGDNTADSFAFTAQDSGDGSIPATAFTIAIRPNTDGVGPVRPPAVTPTSPPPPPSLPTVEDEPTKKDATPVAPPPPPSTAVPASGITASMFAASDAPVGGAGVGVPTAPEPTEELEKLQPPPVPAPLPPEPEAISVPSSPPVRIAPAPPPPVVIPPPPAVVLGAAEVAFIAAPSGKMSQSLTELHEKITRENDVLHLVAGTAVVSLGLSVGYILWTLRAGYMIATMLSTMPAWQFVDPLPILNDPSLLNRKRRSRAGDDEGESLATMIDYQGPGPAADRAA